MYMFATKSEICVDGMIVDQDIFVVLEGDE